MRNLLYAGRLEHGCHILLCTVDHTHSIHSCQGTGSQVAHRAPVRWIPHMHTARKCLQCSLLLLKVSMKQHHT
jgi:hypothetical protein